MGRKPCFRRRAAQPKRGPSDETFAPAARLWPGSWGAPHAASWRRPGGAGEAPTTRSRWQGDKDKLEAEGLAQSEPISAALVWLADFERAFGRARVLFIELENRKSDWNMCATVSNANLAKPKPGWRRRAQTSQPTWPPTDRNASQCAQKIK